MTDQPDQVQNQAAPPVSIPELINVLEQAQRPYRALMQLEAIARDIAALEQRRVEAERAAIDATARFEHITERERRASDEASAAARQRADRLKAANAAAAQAEADARARTQAAQREAAAAIAETTADKDRQVAAIAAEIDAKRGELAAVNAQLAAVQGQLEALRAALAPAAEVRA